MESSESDLSESDEDFRKHKFYKIVDRLMENIERCGAKLIKSANFDNRTDLIRKWLKHEFVRAEIINTLVHSEEGYLVDQIIRSSSETHRQAIREIYVIIKMYEFNLELDKNINIISQVDKSLDKFKTTLDASSMFTRRTTIVEIDEPLVDKFYLKKFWNLYSHLLIFLFTFGYI